MRYVARRFSAYTLNNVLHVDVIIIDLIGKVNKNGGQLAIRSNSNAAKHSIRLAFFAARWYNTVVYH